jgi:hypothetical protein
MNRTPHVGLVIGGFLIALGGLLAGCSVVMEATRPAPVRLAQFNKGQSPDAVIAKLGRPISSTTDADGASCDLYSLPLSGYGNGGKASIAFGEVVADVFTLGIAEAISTPTEAITRNKKTPVWFCYKNRALVRVTPKRLAGEDLASSEGNFGPPPAHPGAASTSMQAPAANAAAGSATAPASLPSVP